MFDEYKVDIDGGCEGGSNSSYGESGNIPCQASNGRCVITQFPPVQFQLPTTVRSRAVTRTISLTSRASPYGFGCSLCDEQVPILNPRRSASVDDRLSSSLSVAFTRLRPRAAPFATPHSSHASRSAPHIHRRAIADKLFEITIATPLVPSPNHPQSRCRHGADHDHLRRHARPSALNRYLGQAFRTY